MYSLPSPQRTTKVRIIFKTIPNDSCNNKLFKIAPTKRAQEIISKSWKFPFLVQEHRVIFAHFERKEIILYQYGVTDK
jgi:hypothetical protein